MSMADCRAALLSSAELVSGTVTVAAFAVATFAAVVVAVSDEEDAVKSGFSGPVFFQMSPPAEWKPTEEDKQEKGRCQLTSAR